MKKLIFLLTACFAFSLNAIAEVDPYVVDNNAIDEVFAQAQEVSLLDLSQSAVDALSTPMVMESQARVSEWGAWALCTFLGGFGIHRHYMGTAPFMWAAYTFTFGGIFGVVTTVDWVVLLIGAIQGNIGNYTNNAKFFMWL
ncbi:MAG: NINE protein [Bacteroidales bacterium]|nr:NINE protein [Bacteroidales bacterium]